MKFQELKTKEIVRVSDGKKLGYAEDLVIDEVTNSVVALRVPKPARGFKKPEYMEISFENISKIGENVILVSEKIEEIEVQKTEHQSEFYFQPKIFKRQQNQQGQNNKK